MASASSGRQRAGQDDPNRPYGYFDGVIAGQATGWCWRASDPSARLAVEVVVDGEVAATGVAQGRRENVARAGFGDGRYGFRIQLPERLADGGSHRVRVLADGIELTAPPTFISRGTTSRAQTSPAQTSQDQASPDQAVAGPWATTQFAPEAAAAETEPDADADQPARRWRRFRRGRADSANGAGLTGYIDGVVAGELIGWVVDLAHPDQPVTVEALLDREPLGIMAADSPRPDVARAGHGERHGFRFEVPAGFTAGIHLVEVRTVDGQRPVPLASDYVVIDEAGQPVDGATLRAAAAAAPPPPWVRPQATLLGSDGWLFEWPGAEEFDALRGAMPLRAGALESQLLRLEERAELARAADAVLVQAILPSRLAVYSEHLPAGALVSDAGRPAELLAADVRELNGIDLLDLTAPLRHARARGSVFAATARSLTWPGAFAAYRAIAKELARLQPRLEPVRRSVLSFAELEPVDDSLADLPRMAWLGAHAIAAGTAGHDEEAEGHPRLDWSVLSGEYVALSPELSPSAGPASTLLRHTRGAELEGRALLIHDGSAGRIAPFLAEHFEQTLIVGEGADLEAVLAAFIPGVIVEVVAEGALLQVPDDP